MENRWRRNKFYDDSICRGRVYPLQIDNTSPPHAYHTAAFIPKRIDRTTNQLFNDLTNQLQIQRAANRKSGFVDHMCVGHGRIDIRMAHQLLDGANILAVFQQVGGKRMP